MVESMCTTEADVAIAVRDTPLDAPSRRRYTLTALMQARWQLAVATELAEPGILNLFPVFVGRELVDFKFLDVCAAAAAYLGAEPDAFVNRTVTDMLGRGDESAALIRVYARVFNHGSQAIEATAGRRSVLGSSVLHHVSKSGTGISVLLTCPDARARKATAEDQFTAWHSLAAAKPLSNVSANGVS